MKTDPQKKQNPRKTGKPRSRIRSIKDLKSDERGAGKVKGGAPKDGIWSNHNETMVIEIPEV